MLYFNKYKKYKNKYTSLKLKDPTIKSLVNTKFDEEFKKNIYSGIMKLEFVHDLGKNKIENKIFYDLINKKEIYINETVPSDSEDYIIKQILNFNDGVFKNNYSLDNTEFNIKSIADYHVVFDNVTYSENLINKLKVIFGINNYYETFIGSCEKMIQHKNKLSDQFFENGKLKSKYIKESLLIGFLPISQNTLINYIPFKKFANKLESIEGELKILHTFCKEVITIYNSYRYELKLDEEFYLYFINSIKKINDVLDEYFKESNNKLKLDLYIVNKTKIEQIIYSMKEARDSYYIEELEEILQENKKTIFVTTDKILTFRCILKNIPVINITNFMIKFIVLFDNNKLRIIGNPFELLDTDNPTKYQSEKTKSIINNIIGNPIFKIKKDMEIHSKYIKTEYNLLDTKFIRKAYDIFYDDIFDDDTTYINIQKESVNVIKYLLNIGKEIHTYNEFFECLYWLQYNLSDNETAGSLKSGLTMYIYKISSGIKYYTEEFKLNITDIKPSTYLFLFLYMYGWCSNIFCNTRFYDLIIKIKTYLPNIKFDYNEIININCSTEIELYKEESEDEYNNIISLIKNN